MNHSLKIALTLLTAGMLFSACEDEEPNVGFELSTKQITVGAVGGTENIRIESAGHWTANTESPWIVVSPTNGSGSVNCQIKVDTTLLADDVREGTVRFITDGQSEPLDLRVIQTGFEQMISLSETEVTIPYYGAFNDRTFDVELTSNVDFRIEVPENWVSYSDYDFELDRGSRPRTVNLRFKWENNTRPQVRDAVIKFIPKNDIALARQDELKISQEEAPEIGDNREGDSLAVIGCARSLGFMLGSNEGENMNNWDFVTMWEPTDEGFTEDKRGRLKSVTFQFFRTKDGIPYELQYLTKAEEITLYSNSNVRLYDFHSGEYLAKLTQLKRLHIFAFGLSQLDDSFTALKNLEELTLACNNFSRIPDLLTPENFPNLKYLELAANRRYTITDLSTTTYDQEEWGGLFQEFPERLLKWEKLEYLSLGFNYLYGSLPDMEDYEVRYSSEEIMQNDTLPDGTNNPAQYSLIGKPKVLPNARTLRINLNLLSGELPEWLLYHPRLMDWDPTTLIFNQGTEVRDQNGNLPGFTNTPEKPDYYYEAYPLKEPEEYE